jgi:hypothetical protein
MKKCLENYQINNAIACEHMNSATNRFWCTAKKAIVESCPITGDCYCPDGNDAESCPYK